MPAWPMKLPPSRRRRLRPCRGAGELGGGVAAATVAVFREVLLDRLHLLAGALDGDLASSVALGGRMRTRATRLRRPVPHHQPLLAGLGEPVATSAAAAGAEPRPWLRRAWRAWGAAAALGAAAPPSVLGQRALGAAFALGSGFVDSGLGESVVCFLKCVGEAQPIGLDLELGGLHVRVWGCSPPG